jgi:hypothetical protein
MNDSFQATVTIGRMASNGAQPSGSFWWDLAAPGPADFGSLDAIVSFPKVLSNAC